MVTYTLEAKGESQDGRRAKGRAHLFQIHVLVRTKDFHNAQVAFLARNA